MSRRRTPGPRRRLACPRRRVSIHRMARSRYASVDDYLAAQSPPTRRALDQVRRTVRKALPGATEGISYQIPIYKLEGAMVLYFAGFQQHYSIYPATEHVVGALKKELAGRLHSKGTIRFSLTEPVPVRLISRIAKLRAEETLARRAAKAAAKVAAKAAAKKARKAMPRARTGPTRQRR